MIKKVFIIRDKVTEKYGEPFYNESLNDAQRGFAIACASVKEVSKGLRCASDYALFHAGEYDDVSGQLIGIQPVFVCDGIE